MESKGRSHHIFIVLEHLDLEDIELLEDFSVSSSFPQSDEQLFQSEDDILQSQLYKSTDCAPMDLDDERISSHKYEDENIGGLLEIKDKKRDSAKRNAKERFYLLKNVFVFFGREFDKCHTYFLL